MQQQYRMIRLRVIVFKFTITLDDIPYCPSVIPDTKLRSQPKSLKITFRYNDHYSH